MCTVITKVMISKIFSAKSSKHGNLGRLVPMLKDEREVAIISYDEYRGYALTYIFFNSIQQQMLPLSYGKWLGAMKVMMMNELSDREHNFCDTQADRAVYFSWRRASPILWMNEEYNFYLPRYIQRYRINWSGKMLGYRLSQYFFMINIPATMRDIEPSVIDIYALSIYLLLSVIIRIGFL